MSDPLAWTGAIGGAVAATAGIIAAVGAWRTEITARWQARAEAIRTDKARRENELHRQRFAEIWNWQRDQPDGDERARAARWFGEWAGASGPYRGGKDSPPQTPGLHSADVADAYDRYVEFLRAVYEPGTSARPDPSGQRRPGNHGLASLPSLRRWRYGQCHRGNDCG